MKQSQTTPTPQKDRRRIPSPSALWRMWMDNLKEWRFYLEENRHTPVDIAGWFGKIRKQLRSFMTSGMVPTPILLSISLIQIMKPLPRKSSKVLRQRFTKSCYK